jgi:hypothetical protein
MPGVQPEFVRSTRHSDIAVLRYTGVHVMVNEIDAAASLSRSHAHNGVPWWADASVQMRVGISSDELTPNPAQLPSRNSGYPISRLLRFSPAFCADGRADGAAEQAARALQQPMPSPPKGSAPLNGIHGRARRLPSTAAGFVQTSPRASPRALADSLAMTATVPGTSAREGQVHHSLEE